LNWSVEILGCIPVNAQRILFAGDSTDALAGLKKAFAQRNPQANWTVWLAQSPDLASGTAKDFDVILLDFQWLVLDAMGRSRLYELDLFFKPADDLEQSADRTQTVICFYQNAYRAERRQNTNCDLFLSKRLCLVSAQCPIERKVSQRSHGSSCPGVCAFVAPIEAIRAVETS